jgi:hypothetical protein
MVQSLTSAWRTASVNLIRPAAKLTVLLWLDLGSHLLKRLANITADQDRLHATPTDGWAGRPHPGAEGRNVDGC